LIQEQLRQATAFTTGSVLVWEDWPGFRGTLCGRGAAGLRSRDPRTNPFVFLRTLAVAERKYGFPVLLPYGISDERTRRYETKKV
jgi:hypothetical protein